MRANVLEIPIIKSESQRKLGLDVSLREAVADHLKDRWRTGTAKCAAIHYDLTLDRAREACAGRASLTTIERIFKVGGWPVYLGVGARILGQTVAAYLSELRASHEQNASRLAAVLGDAWPVPAPRVRAADHLDSPLAERRNFDRRRVGQRDAD